MTEENLHGLDTELEQQLAAEVRRQRAEASEDGKEEPVFSDIRKNIRFRLMGYGLNDEPIPWATDVRHLTTLEKKLVIDPVLLKEEFRKMRALRPTIGSDDAMHEYTLSHTQFGKWGAHSSRNKKDTLYRARREGWVLYAGFETKDKGFHAIGFNYGLNAMPEDDEELRNLSLSTIPQNVRERINPAKTSVNWRTGIAETVDPFVLRDAGVAVPEGVHESISTRRLGIASALKYILTSMAQKREKERVAFNIGTLYDAADGSEEHIRNAPSFHHNTRIFREDLGYRMYNSDIVIKGRLGFREKVGYMMWRARHDKVSEAMSALVSENGVLRSRNWDIENLERTATHFHELLDAEKKKG